MTLAVIGSRRVQDYRVVEFCLRDLTRVLPAPIVEVVSGGARGVDSLAETWARVHRVQFRVFPADWRTLGRKAGHVRNVEIADYLWETGGACLAIWDGLSRGTRNMIAACLARGVPVWVWLVDETLLAPEEPTWKG